MENTIETTVDTIENGVGATEQNNNESKFYSAEEVQSLVDKRVTQALQTQQKKFEKQFSLSKLDGVEREKAEKDNRIAELEEQLKAFQVEKNKSEIKSVLSSRGLSAEFADIINITDDIEAAQVVIDKFDKLVKAAVKAEVEKRLAGNAPKGNGGTPAEVTKEAAMKMSLAELQQLERTNPEIYNKIFN